MSRLLAPLTLMRALFSEEEEADGGDGITAPASRDRERGAGGGGREVKACGHQRGAIGVWNVFADKKFGDKKAPAEMTKSIVLKFSLITLSPYGTYVLALAQEPIAEATAADAAPVWVRLEA